MYSFHQIIDNILRNLTCNGYISGLAALTFASAEYDSHWGIKQEKAVCVPDLVHRKTVEEPQSHSGNFD